MIEISSSLKRVIIVCSGRSIKLFQLQRSIYMRNSQMLSNHPYPYQHVTPEELQALIRRAHAERAEAVADFFHALFRRKPQATRAEPQPSLSAAACR
jgi:hypothetical protein